MLRLRSESVVSPALVASSKASSVRL
jgi:hypothetical protein